MVIQLTGLILVFCIIIFIDLNGLQNAKQSKKVVSIYFTILTFGFVISLLLIIDKAPPSPATYIGNIIDILVPR